MKWNELDDITQLLGHQLRSDMLWHLIERAAHITSSRMHASGPSHDLPTSPHTCNSRDRINNILNCDIMCIAARVLSILYDHQRRHLLLDQQEEQAQTVLDLLQAASLCIFLGFLF